PSVDPRAHWRGENMSAQRPTSPWTAWRPDDYFRDYYSAEVRPDEREAIRFQADFLHRAGQLFPTALEYGCGPTLMRAVAAAKYVRALHLADPLESNLSRGRPVASGDGNACDWSAFTRYVLQCEGVARPGPADVLAREGLTRKVITDLLPTDAREPYPLGEHRAERYDLLITGFCVEAVSRAKAAGGTAWPTSSAFSNAAVRSCWRPCAAVKATGSASAGSRRPTSTWPTWGRPCSNAAATRPCCGWKSGTCPHTTLRATTASCWRPGASWRSVRRPPAGRAGSRIKAVFQTIPLFGDAFP